MFSWANIPESNNSRRCHAAIQRAMSYDNYGFDDEQWNLTGVIKSHDPRKAFALMILDSKLVNGERHESISITGPDGNPILFRLHVLSRYACKLDKNGHRLFKSEDGYKRSGSEGDVLLKPGDKPVAGDKVQFKISPKIMNEDGLEITSLEMIAMSEDGRDIYDRKVFTVDEDLCITLPNPYALMALRRNGHKINFPEFSTQYRPRKITNWWYKEVPRDFNDLKQQNLIEPVTKGKK